MISFTMETAIACTPDQLVQALQTIIQQYEIYRVKGFVHVPGKPMRMVLQGVSQRFDYYFDRLWKEGEERKTALVVIGHDLNIEAVDAAFRQALATITNK